MQHRSSQTYQASNTCGRQVPCDAVRSKVSDHDVYTCMQACELWRVPVLASAECLKERPHDSQPWQVASAGCEANMWCLPLTWTCVAQALRTDGPAGWHHRGRKTRLELVQLSSAQLLTSTSSHKEHRSLLILAAYLPARPSVVTLVAGRHNLPWSRVYRRAVAVRRSRPL